jgi:hypothetical protein
MPPLVTTKIRINVTAAGNTVILFISPGTRIIVISVSLFANDNVDVTFQRDLPGVVYAGPFHLATMGGFVLPENESGWFQTGLNDGLTMNLSTTTVVSGSLSYIRSTT